jgi:hypothetical protein
MLGASPIVSLEDGSTEANALKTLYEPAKKNVLRSYPWRCATKTATLALLDETPVDPSWDYAYSVPNDSIRVLAVKQPLSPVTIEWTIEGKKILTNETGAIANYIFNVTESQLDAHVEMALSAKLALDLSYTLTASNTREGNMFEMYEQKLNEARTTDRQEASSKVFVIDRLAAVRR